MNLSSILKPEAVRVISDAGSKKRLFQQLGEVASAAHGMQIAESVEALLDRESLGPTGVGRGVALPHARISGLEKVAGVFVRLEKPVDFSAVDREPVDLVFALFAPEGSGVDHLKALASVSRMLRDQSICSKLRANSDADTLHTILTDTPASEAAA